MAAAGFIGQNPSVSEGAERVGGIGIEGRSGLEGGTEGRAFAALEADGGDSEDIGADLTPEGVFARAAGEADFAGGNAELAEAVEAIAEAEGDAFESGAHEVGGGPVFRSDA